MPKISIIIPIYGVERFIRDCLETIETQTLKDIEVIGVDDGTKDNSAKIFDEFVAKDNRFKLLHQENAGAGMARNFGMSVATGEYICYMDPDDFYPDDKVLEDIHDELTRSGADICSGSLNIFKEPGAPNFPLDDFIYKRCEWVEYRDSLRIYVFQTFTFSRDFLCKNKIEFPPYRTYEDPPFLVHALTTAGRFRSIPRAVYTYRLPDKKINVPTPRIYDMAKGAGDILLYTKDNLDYCPLHDLCVNNYFGDFTQGNKTAAGNLFLKLILRGDVRFTRLMRDMSLHGNDGVLLPPLKRITGMKRTGQLPSDFTGLDWKVILWRYRMKNGFTRLIRCFSENGLWHTVKRIFSKIFSRNHND